MPLTISDSITIAILNRNALITGVGNKLHLYTNDQKANNQLLHVTLRGKVHGIISGTQNNSDKLLVYGEKEYLLLKWSKDYTFETLDRGYITDWISAAKFLNEPNNVVLLSAHSTAVCLEYRPDNKKCGISQRSSCSDKSTLYSALVCGDHWRQLVCFGGNAYGELLIWRPTGPKAPLLQRVASHNGVIFSINYSAAAHMLITTSDDRSIRFWRVAHHSPEEWTETKLTPVASGFGHLARVFQGKIVKSGVNFYAVTAGEDSYICIWRMTGELIYKSRQQFGAIIWNLEYDETNKILYTVGSTGNVLPYHLQDIFDNEDNRGSIREINTAVSLPRPNENYIKNGNVTSEHYVAKIKFLNPNCLVGLTNKNQLICYKNAKAWDLVDDFADSKCTVLEVKQNQLAVCGYKRLTLYRYKATIRNGLIEKYYDCNSILDRLIRAFVFLTPQKYLVCDDGGNCVLLHESSDGSMTEHRISLPKCKEPWLTSAALIEMVFLLIGNRQGNMFLYRWNEAVDKFDQTFTLKHPHGYLGATLVKLVANAAETALLQSAGHDGTIKHIKLCKIEAALKIVKRENVPVSWVEALEPMYDDLNTELLFGFNDNHFVIWSRQHDFSVQLSCGGGHRYWDYFIYDKSPGRSPRIKIVFIKNKQVLLYDRKLLCNTSPNLVFKLPPRNRWHVKPCNVLKCIEDPTLMENAYVIISGGDDNLIKISKYDNAERSQQTLQQLTEVHSHISNIRAMTVLKENSGSAADYLIFTGGGRAQLCVTKFNTKSLQVEEMLNVTLKTIHASSNAGSNSKDFSIDPEMRIMSLDVLPSTRNHGYTVFIGCSDGFVRKYEITENWQITLLADLDYGKCILQVRLVGQQFLLIAATDGLINCASLDMARLDVLIQHHLSGVNAIDIRYTYENQELEVLTGGDDQTMAFSRLSLPSLASTLPIVLETVKFETLHTAQVTAVQLSSCGHYAYSSGVDQNLFKTDLRTREVVEEFRACIADIKGLCVDSSDNICMLYGCGLQIHCFN